MSLRVRARAHDDPTEHGVTAVPDLGLGGRTPSPRGEIRIFLRPVLHGIVEDGASDAGAWPGVEKRGDELLKRRDAHQKEK